MPDSWTELWGANAVWALDAVTQSADGLDVVFALGGDGRLEEFIPSITRWQKLADGGTFNGFSAGLDIRINAPIS